MGLTKTQVEKMPLDELKSELRKRLDRYEREQYDELDEEDPKRVRLEQEIGWFADTANALITAVASQ